MTHGWWHAAAIVLLLAAPATARAASVEDLVRASLKKGA